MKSWKILSEKQFFSSIIRMDELELKRVLEHKDEYYCKEICIPKKNGCRLVYGINKEHLLYKVQKNLLNNFLKNIKVSDVACGFLKQSSYYDFLERHTDFYCQNYYLRLDIKDFFGSISWEMVYNAIKFYCQIEDQSSNEKVLELICDIVTYRDIIVQGAITSPYISNIVFRRIDIRIQKYCIACGVQYTRYADDLLFSGKDKRLLKQSFSKNIAKILNECGFEVNYDKRIKGYGRVSLNGFIISDTITLSRKKLKDINRVIFYLKGKKQRLSNVKAGNLEPLNSQIEMETNIKNRFKGKYELINYLNGYRAFLISVVKKTEDQAFIKKAQSLIQDIEFCVGKISL